MRKSNLASRRAELDREAATKVQARRPARAWPPNVRAARTVRVLNLNVSLGFISVHVNDCAAQRGVVNVAREIISRRR